MIGCDCGSGPLPGERFADFEQAEQALGGQILEVAVVDHDEQVLASTELPAVVPSGRIYFSDSSGCRRKVFETNEEIWVTMLRPPFSRPSVLSLELEDANAVPGLAQEVSLPQYGARFMVRVDDHSGLVPERPYFGSVTGKDAGGEVVTVIVEVPADRSSHSYALRPEPLSSNGSNPNGGIVITLDSCTPDRP